MLEGTHPKFTSHHEIFKDTEYSETRSLQDADFIFVPVPQINGEDQTDPKAFEHELKKITDISLPMVCANPDLFAHEGNPPKSVVRQGTIGKIYEEMGGSVFYIGKPYPLAFQTALKKFRQHGLIDSTKILMVGIPPKLM